MFMTVFDVKYNNWDDRMILVIRISRNQAEHQNFSDLITFLWSFFALITIKHAANIQNQQDNKLGGFFGTKIHLPFADMVPGPGLRIIHLSQWI